MPNWNLSNETMLALGLTAVALVFLLILWMIRRSTNPKVCRKKVVGILAYSLYVTAQKGVKAQTAGIISGMETVYGIVFALIFLREIPTVRELVGGAVILGIAFYSSLHSED